MIRRSIRRLTAPPRLALVLVLLAGPALAEPPAAPPAPPDSPTPSAEPATPKTPPATKPSRSRLAAAEGSRPTGLGRSSQLEGAIIMPPRLDVFAGG